MLRLRHSQASCLSIGRSVERGSPDRVGSEACITDSYGCRITRDRSNPDNVGPGVFVPVSRGDRSTRPKTRYANQMTVDAPGGTILPVLIIDSWLADDDNIENTCPA